MYSVVLPVVKNSKGWEIFFTVSLPLYRKYLDFSEIKDFFIICPYVEVEKIKNELTEEVFKVIPEENLLNGKIIDQKGWYKQQLLKLYVSSIITTKYYLVVDSDMFLVNNLKFTDFFTGKKLRYSYEPWHTKNTDEFSTNSEWWKNSCKILDYDVKKLVTLPLMSVTPQVLITSVVRLLLTTLEEKYENVQLTLCDEKFTEFTLYWVFLLKHKFTHLYTTSGKPLWNHDKNTNILSYGQPHKIVSRAFLFSPCWFSVIQSYLDIDLSPYINEAVKNIDRKIDHVFLVASMLIPSRPQSFIPAERFQQTLETYNSTLKIPNSFTILIEGSEINDYVRYVYNQHFDYVLEMGNNSEVKKYVTDPRNIGHGEMKLLQKGIEFLQDSLLKKHKPKYIFKLGARYKLNDNFKIENYSHEKYTVRMHKDTSINQDVMTTGLFSIPLDELESFRKILEKGQKILSDYCPMIERLFIDMIPRGKFYKIENLGVEGQLSYNRNFFSV